MEGLLRLTCLLSLLIFAMSAGFAHADGCVTRNNRTECWVELRMPEFNPPKKGECKAAELLANFKWFHADAVRSSGTARTRGILMRAVDNLDDSTIRKYYKEGQRHNSNAAGLIDDCDAAELESVALAFAEAGRLQQCGDSPPAVSATCGDISENLRWSMLESGPCAAYARDLIIRGVDMADYRHVKARFVRRGLKVAQSHNPPVWDSVNFVGDGLLLKLAGEAIETYGARSLERKKRPATASPFDDCPGIQHLTRILDLNEVGNGIEIPDF